MPLTNTLNEWYYLDGQNRKGAFSLEAMKQMLQACVIQPETWVARQGDSDWGPAATLLSSPQTNIPPPMSPPPASKRGISKWMVAGAVVLALIVVIFSANRPERHRYSPSSNSEYEMLFGKPVNSSYQGVTGQSTYGNCGRCNGSGRSGNAILECPSCSGRGTGTTPSGYSIVCNRCGGPGRIQMTCEVCGGSGRSR